MAAALGLGLAALAAPAAAQAQRLDGPEGPEGLTLAPSRVEATIAAGLRVGPFELTNRSDQGYKARVFPVLLRQDRVGGLLIDEEPGALRRARRFFRSDTESFGLRRGGSGSAIGVLRRIPPQGSFYGGLLFEATPRGNPEGQVREILRLNASVLLDPPRSERRLRLGAERIRAEQPEGKSIRLLMPVLNRGNAYLPASGQIEVRDEAGERRARVSLRGIRILPGAVVELPGRLRAPLEQGVYTLRGTARMATESVRARGRIEIAADGRLVFRDAELAELPTPSPEVGEAAEVEASFLNTGNSSFAPRAEALVTPAGERGGAAVPQELSAEEVEPGEQGTVGGEVELPGEASSYELEVVLLEGTQRLDSRTVSISPRPATGFLDDLEDWIRRNAVVLVVALLVLSLLLATLLARRRAAASGAEPAGEVPGDETIAEPEPDAAAPAEEARGGAAGGEPGEKPGPAPRLAEVGFEELREMGLSVTQATRLLEQRMQGRLQRVEQIGPGSGLSAELAAELRRRLRD